MADGKIVITLKAGTGYDAPWLVFGTETQAEAHLFMEEAHEKDLFTAIGRASDAFKRGVALGAGLGARTIEVSSIEDVSKVKAQAVASTSKAKTKAKAEPRPEPEALAESKPAPKAAPPAGAPKPAWAK